VLSAAVFPSALLNATFATLPDTASTPAAAHARDAITLVVIAAPKTLGALRKNWHKELESRLTGEIAEHLADVVIHVSLTHDGDTAAAVAILETL
jgi:hypothetical protein